MRAACLLLALAACGESPEPACELPAGLPVFPGAEGFGTDTRAGRGGRVLEVTTLADDGAGSLRDALAQEGARIVVFRVGGTIELASQLEVHEPYLTIAGQTAPGDGVLIKGAGLVIFTHDVLVQHLRVRPGAGEGVDPEVNDAFIVLGSDGEESWGAHHVVLDHVTAAWSEDEALSAHGGVHDVTVSWSIVAEALDRSRHPKGTHSAGLFFGYRSSCMSAHHNLLAHNGFRNPLIHGGGRHDVVNNLVYDWGVLGAELLPGNDVTEVNFVANLYLPGPSTQPDIREVVTGSEHPVARFVNPTVLFAPAGEARLYLEGNLGPNRADGDDEWALVSYGYGATDVPPEARGPYERFRAPPVTTVPADELAQLVLPAVGVTRPLRDPVDARLVADVTHGTGRIIDDTDDAGGYLPLAGGQAPADGDHDGMPDTWESAAGLDPADPADGNSDRDGDGYTNVEEYLFTR